MAIIYRDKNDNQQKSFSGALLAIKDDAGKFHLFRAASELTVISPVSVQAGGNVTVSLTLPAEFSGKEVIWSIADGSRARFLSASGSTGVGGAGASIAVYGLTEGSTTITATVAGVSFSATLTVTAAGGGDTPSTPTGTLHGTGYGTGADGQTNSDMGEVMVVNSIGGAYIKVVFDSAVDGSGFTKMTLESTNEVGRNSLHFGGGVYTKSGNAWNLTAGTGKYFTGASAVVSTPAGTGTASVEWKTEGGKTVAEIRCNVIPENGYSYNKVTNATGVYVSTFDVTFE